MGNYLLGFDVGTYESKGTLCDLSGKIVATASAQHKIRSPQPGYAEHDPINDWWADFNSVLQALLAKSGIKTKDIAAIGISTIMAGIVPVDENCNPLRNAILYGIDTRCVDQAQRLNQMVGEENQKRVGVCTVEEYGPKILWIRENEPEVFAKAKKITIASAFLTARLTGEYYIDRYSAEDSAPMLDTKTLQWDDECCPYVCPKEMLPNIAESTYSVIGTVTAKAAAETGLAKGTPVICGTTDAGAEAVSVGVTAPGDAMLMYGSTAFYLAVTDQPRWNTGIWCGHYTINNLFSYAGGMATTGSLTRWLRDNAAKDLIAVEEQGGLNAYEALFAEAEQITPGSDGLVCLPYFQGERMPIQDPLAKGVYFGLNLRHTRGHLVRATLEGIGFGIEQNFALLREKAVQIRDVTAVGGGAKSRLWLQIVSDICSLSQHVPEVTIGASYGDALMAGLGIGVIDSPEAIKKLVRIRETIEPDLERHLAYQPYRELFRSLYERNKDLMHMI